MWHKRDIAKELVTMTHPRPIKVRDNGCRDPRLAGITIHLYLYVSVYVANVLHAIINSPCIINYSLCCFNFSDKTFCSKIFSLINRVVEIASAKQR